jgi:hypothetical protein
MNKTLALVALLGLVAAPAFANEAPAAAPAAPAVKAEKVVVKDEVKKDGEEKAADVKVEVKKGEEKK